METNSAVIKGNKYFLQVYAGIEFRHGGIGNTDAESIFAEEGFSPIRLPDSPSLLVHAKRWLAMRSLVRLISSNDLVICQFPVYPRMYRLLLKQLHRKAVPLAVLIADIDGLKDGNDQLLQEEISQLKMFRYFMVHNAAMENWLREKIPGAIITQLGPFDFLTDVNSNRRSKSDWINFSGNLEKSKFLSDLSAISQVRFYLYGEGYDKVATASANVEYQGVYPPYELPAKLLGSYGLVWDGDSIHGAAGSLGNYMQFINHHKLSLYILAGMPVIVPAFAGSAEYVQEKGIGWLINDLTEIPGLLASISDAEYASAQNKMVPIAAEISKGNHLRNALKRIFNS